MVVRLILRKDKADPAGLCPVHVRLSYRNRTKYTSTGLKVKAAHWNARAGRVRRTHPQEPELNAALEDMESRVQTAVFRLRAERPHATPEEMKAAVDRAVHGEEAKRADFLTYGARFLEQYRREGRIGTMHQMRVALSSLEAYHGSVNLPFDMVTPGLLRGFQVWLKEQGLAVNTVNRRLSALRAAYNQAMREGVIPQGISPFAAVKLPSVRVGKVPLSREEFGRIAGLDLPVGSRLWHTRNLFCFQVYALGMRFSDAATVPAGAVIGGRLRYAMRKNQKPVNILLVEPALEIARLYADRKSGFMFPALDGEDLSTPELEYRAVNRKTTLANRRLEQICTLAGVEKHVSTHTARHTFAKFALESGLGVVWIKGALQHGELATTHHYIRDLDPSELDAGLKGIF